MFRCLWLNLISFIVTFGSVTLHEDFFKCCHANPIAQYVLLLHLLVELNEKVSKLICLLKVYLKTNLLAYFSKFLDRAEERFKVRLNFLIRLLVLLNHGQFVASAIAIFEKDRASQADNLTFSHDTNTVSQDVSFVHVMCSQQNYTTTLVVFEHLPNVAPCLNIHSCSWLIKKHKF